MLNMIDEGQQREHFYWSSLAILVIASVLLWLHNVVAPIDRRLGNLYKYKLPSGPGGLPISGNLLLLGRAMSGNTADTLQNLAATYGEMTTLHLGSRTWVLLNSHRVTQEILAKRGNITAERNFMPVASGIVSRKMRSLLLSQTKWTEPRRVMQPLLAGYALKQYGQWQEEESTQMLAEYLYHPERWYNHHYRYANSVVHRVALGHRIEASGEDLGNLQRLVAEFVGSIGSSLVDWFPILDRTPRALQFWRSHWEQVGQFHNDVYHKWWDPVRQACKDGTAPPSWARDVLLNPASKYQGSEEEAMYCAMQLIEAGSDTTREALNIFIMGILKYPEVLQLLRQEIDTVCRDADGDIRLPQMSDLESLSYTHATVKEILRWRPIFAITPEHTLSKDLVFEDYHFPAGVSFVINGPAVANECEDPHDFKPERWQDGNEFNITHGLWQFGAGRRICVGYRLAQQGLVLNVARLAQCFDYAAAGQLDSYALNHETTCEPFPVSVKVRNSHYEALIVAASKAAGSHDIAKFSNEKVPAYTFKRQSALIR